MCQRKTRLRVRDNALVNEKTVANEDKRSIRGGFLTRSRRINNWHGSKEKDFSREELRDPSFLSMTQSFVLTCGISRRICSFSVLCHWRRSEMKQHVNRINSEDNCLLFRVTPLAGVIPGGMKKSIDLVLSAIGHWLFTGTQCFSTTLSRDRISTSCLSRQWASLAKRYDLFLCHLAVSLRLLFSWHRGKRTIWNLSRE